MDYISGIRKYIGHEMVMTAGCSVMIINDRGELLLQKRSDNGLWGLPGGAMEIAETYEEAARRELFEEAGIKVGDLKLFGIYSGKPRVIHYPNDDMVFSLAVVFITDSYEGTISDEDSEVLEYRFFAKGFVPKDLFLPDEAPILDWSMGKEGVIVS